jgi:hypothetical protein
LIAASSVHACPVDHAASKAGSPSAARRFEARLHLALAVRGPHEGSRFTNRSDGGAHPDGVFNFAKELQQLDDVLEAIQHFGVHLERLQGAQRLGESPGGQVEFPVAVSVRPRRHSASASPRLSSGVPAHLEGSCETRLRGPEVACLERNLSQIAFAIALEFLVLDGACDRQALLEELTSSA